jgi:hypothetical protein
MHELGSPPLLCPLGLVAGLLFVGASSLSFVACSFIGLSTGQGVWGGAAILVAFLWGTLGPPPVGLAVVSWPLSLLAVALLFAGVGGYAISTDGRTVESVRPSSRAPPRALRHVARRRVLHHPCHRAVSSVASRSANRFGSTRCDGSTSVPCGAPPWWVV